MERTTRVDFHLHSSASDGYYAPETLAEKLAAANVHYAALTDHDSIDGLAAFQEAAARKGVCAFPGVELRAAFRQAEIHLLAYCFDPRSAAIRSLLGSARDAAQVVARVHEAGGTAFLAHPLEVASGWEELEEWLRELKTAGLDGVEAFYPAYSDEQRERILAIAQRLSLLAVGGSDFHGPGLPGPAKPGIDVPTAAWKRFRDALGGSANGQNQERRKSPVEKTGPPNWRRFFFRILFPAFLAVILFVVFLFAVLIPAMRESLLARKREMIRELTNSAWSILSEYERERREGRLTLEEAQRNAIERIKYLRYGEQGKDYFWITDMQPRMVMHPYRPDLDGRDLSDFTDPQGVRLFVEFVQAVRERGHGYVDYVWQWKDQPEQMAAKQSYVRGFEPWGWVIGTGIYVDDVRKEIQAITGRVIDVSVVISALVGALLLYVAYESLKIDRLRGRAERDLRDSHERYRALVEAATEGTLLILNGRCTFANRPMLDMLGYREEELGLLDLHDIVPDGDEPARSARALLDDLMKGAEAPAQFEGELRRKDGATIRALLTPTRISYAGREGAILVARDISSHKAMEEELGASREKYQSLAAVIPVGVFRAVLDERAALLEMNAAGRKILGLPEDEALPEIGLHDAIPDAQERNRVFKTLRAEGTVKDAVVSLRRTDGHLVTAALSAVLLRGAGGAPDFCDGILEDLSERRRVESERADLIAQLQTSLLFLNEPVGNSLADAATCPMNASIAEAAALMARRDYSAVVVVSPEGEAVGIVTDHDLRERVVAAGADPSRPVFEIMSAPVVSIPDQAPIYEAILLMREKGTRHLLVKSANGKTIGMVRNKELVRFDRYSTSVLIQEIRRASSLDEAAACRRRLTPLVCSLVDSGAFPRNVSRTITAVSDAIVERVIAMAEESLGPPPAPFAFMAMGSEGREEQTLATDQDNAIVYCDPPKERREETAQYFQRLGAKVCDDLHQAGYAFCKGETMARNPRWNLPLSMWERLFERWIVEPEAEELLRFNIVFDFRCVYGEPDLTRTLRAHIRATLENQPAFFLHFARNILRYKPPIGVFGQIVTGADADAPHTFSIKDAALPIVHFARLYALNHGIEKTNTIDRLNELRERGALREDSHREILEAYNCLMQIRYKHHVLAVRDGRVPDNAVNPKALTQIETTTLKQAFAQIALIQKKIGFDFLGTG